MITEFKNRGHFCNYCRKILSSKSPQHIDMNPAIWSIWDSGNRDKMLEFIRALSETTYNADIDHPIKKFNNQLKVILKKYADEKYIKVIKDKRWSKVK